MVFSFTYTYPPFYLQIIDTAEPGENEGGSRRETSPDSRRYPAKDDNDSKEVVGMKITATVPPLPSLLQRNQEHISSMQNQAAAARNDDEGSFAAALRKLAQQAIVPVARRPTAREGQPTPPSSFKPGMLLARPMYLTVTLLSSFLHESLYSCLAIRMGEYN